MTPLQEIERDLDWREAEMAILRILLANQTIAEREKLVLFRAGWSLLYAHYEGFCKFALTVYYDTITKIGKCGKDLSVNTQVFALDKCLKTIRSMPPHDLLAQIRSFETDYMDQPVSFPDVDTESNLWPTTLERLLENADIVVQSLQSYSQSLKTLVGRRNKIAHGERDIIPEFSYYIQFEDAVKVVMYDLAIAIDEKIQSISV